MEAKIIGVTKKTKSVWINLYCENNIQSPVNFVAYEIVLKCKDDSIIACDSLNPFKIGERIEIDKMGFLRSMVYLGPTLKRLDDGIEYKVKRLEEPIALQTPIQAQPI